MVHKKELTFALRQTIEKDLPYCKLKVIFRCKSRLLTHCFDLNIHLRKKSTLE